MTNKKMTPEQENAFHADPDNQMPQGPPVRRKANSASPCPYGSPKICSTKYAYERQPTIAPCPTGSVAPSSTNLPATPDDHRRQFPTDMSAG